MRNHAEYLPHHVDPPTYKPTERKGTTDSHRAHRTFLNPSYQGQLLNGFDRVVIPEGYSSWLHKLQRWPIRTSSYASFPTALLSPTSAHKAHGWWHGDCRRNEIRAWYLKGKDFERENWTVRERRRIITITVLEKDDTDHEARFKLRLNAEKKSAPLFTGKSSNSRITHILSSIV